MILFDKLKFISYIFFDYFRDDMIQFLYFNQQPSILLHQSRSIMFRHLRFVCMLETLQLCWILAHATELYFIYFGIIELQTQASS